MSNRNPTHEKPSHIEQQVWNAWNAIWSSDEFKKKSEQNKINRRKGVVGGKAPPTHNGGSASHKQIAIDIVSVFLPIHIIMVYISIHFVMRFYIFLILLLGGIYRKSSISL